MPVPSNNATASSVNGTLVATPLLLANNDKQARILLTGTYTGVTGTIDVSMDGVSYVNIQAKQEDSGVLVNGTITVSASNLSYLVDADGWLYVRFNCTACASGTCVQTVYSAPSLSSGSNPVIANTSSQTSFTSGTFSGTLGVTGATTLSSTLAVTAAATLSSTLAVTGITTLTGALNVGAEVAPSSNDGAALGDATHNWSDLFLASGAVINVNNSNVVITHTSGILTMGTGELRITTVGTNTASVVTVGGTQTLTNKTLTSPTFTAPVLGVATGTSVAVTGTITSSGPTGGGIGYATGAGGAVSQGTNRSTGVTLSKLTGQITTMATSLAAGAEAVFTVTNTTVAIGDTIILSVQSGPTANTSVYSVSAVAAGSFDIKAHNLHASTADTGAAILNYAVIKAVAA